MRICPQKRIVKKCCGFFQQLTISMHVMNNTIIANKYEVKWN